VINRLFPKRCGIAWCPPWTRLVAWLDLYLNHPYWHPWEGSPGSHWGPLSENVCGFCDWLTNNWAHE
jgi:hypothetical protein